MSADDDAVTPQWYEHVLIAIGVAAMGAGGYFIATNDERWWWSLLMASTCLIFGNLHRIAKFSIQATGLTAETRAVTKKIKSLLPELTKLAMMTGVGLVENSVTAGRFGGTATLEKADNLRKRVVATLKDIGLSEEDIHRELHQVERPWYAFDYASGISRLAQTRLKDDDKFKLIEYRKKTDFNEPPTPAALLELLEGLGAADDEVRELIEDYRFYLETGTHRRPEVWAKRAEWPH